MSAPSIPPTQWLASTRETLRTLLSFDTSPEGAEHLSCAHWLRECLESLGFGCRMYQLLPHDPPVLEAHRPARDMRGHLVMYNHYDVVSARPARPTESPSPPVLEESEGRWFARGVADNKGPLAARLVALSAAERTPALTWLIQGQEETGSHVASRVFAERMPLLDADLWLEETGYHDHADGTLRLIARGVGAAPDVSVPPDASLSALLDELRGLARRWNIATRLEVRGLNKGAVEGGCPFNRHLPVGARYLALGVNDSRSQVHGDHESVPLWTFALHAEELRVVFGWMERMDRGRT